jgi:hypothetical protein
LSKPRNGLLVSLLSSTQVRIETLATPHTLTYFGADGETLTVRWEGRFSRFNHGHGLFAEGHVVGKEYHSHIEAKLRGLWNRLRRMFHW